METTREANGGKVVAFFVMAWSLGWLARYRSLAPDDAVALGVTGLIGLCGLAVASAAWRARPGSLRGYTLWAIAHAAGLVFLDARVEPVWWRVVVAGLGTALVLAIFGLVLSDALRRHRADPE